MQMENTKQIRLKTKVAFKISITHLLTALQYSWSTYPTTISIMRHK